MNAHDQALADGMLERLNEVRTAFGAPALQVLPVGTTQSSVDCSGHRGLREVITADFILMPGYISVPQKDADTVRGAWGTGILPDSHTVAPQPTGYTAVVVPTEVTRFINAFDAGELPNFIDRATSLVPA